MKKEELYLQGMDRFAEDDLAGAIQIFEEALQIDRDYVDVLHSIAMCYYHLKQYPKAVEFGLRFKEQDPENPLAYTSLSMFYNAQGLIAKAEDMGAKGGAVAPPEEMPE